MKSRNLIIKLILLKKRNSALVKLLAKKGNFFKTQKLTKSYFWHFVVENSNLVYRLYCGRNSPENFIIRFSFIVFWLRKTHLTPLVIMLNKTYQILVLYLTADEFTDNWSFCSW